jgi:CRISPR/Cas system-associated protein endoribonuclease Cas2
MFSDVRLLCLFDVVNLGGHTQQALLNQFRRNLLNAVYVTNMSQRLAGC